MNEQELKSTVASNITAYRKLYGYTQLEFAEKLNYSDKAVSKWERGESLPDIFVLSKIAEMFEITLNDLTSSSPGKRLLTASAKKKKHQFITALAVGLVWLSFSVVFFLLKVFDFSVFMPSFVFILAVPVSFIVLVVFGKLWWSLAFRSISVSALIWSTAAAIAFPFENKNLYYAFLVASVLQILTILWFWMKRHSRKH